MRWALRIAGAGLAVLVVAAVAVLVLLQTEAGARLAARAVGGIASTPGETEVQIGRLAPGLPFRLALSGLAVADAEGVWLAAERIEVRWGPLDLLRGRLAIAEATAGGIRLSRLPEGAPEPKDRGEPFSLPSLPLDLAVDRFALDDVEIGPAVAGEAVALRASGEIAAEREGHVRTNVEVVRTNGAGGSARLAAAWDAGGERLSLDGHADEPEGGLTASLLGMAGRPPVRLSFTGEGPVDGWEGRLDGVVGDDVGIVAGVRTEDTVDGVRIEVSGRARVAPLLPERARALAADGIAFAAVVRRADGDMLVIEAADVEAGGVRLSGEGALDLDDGRFDEIHLTLSAADAAGLASLLAPASFGAGEARIRLDGPWTAPDAELSADVADLRAGAAGIARSEVRGVIAAAADGGYRLEAEAVFTGVRAQETDVDALLGAPPRLQLIARFDRRDDRAVLERLEVLGPALTAIARGVYGLGSGEGRVALRASVPSLAAFAGVAGPGLSGEAALAVDARLVDGGLGASLGLGTSGLRSGVPAVDVLLGEAPSLRAALRTDPATGGLRLDDVVLSGQGMQATAAAVLREGAVDAGYRFDVPDVTQAAAAAGVAASGALAIDGRVSGPASDPGATAVLTLTDGQVADIVTSPVRVGLTAESLTSGPRGLLSAAASAAGEPLRLSVSFAREGSGRLRLGPVDGSGAGARLAGSLSLPRQGGAVLGALNLRAGGEGQPVALAGHRLDGETDLRVVLGEKDGRQTVEVAGSGAGLALATPQGPLASAENLSLSATLTGGDTPGGDVTLRLVGPSAAGVALAGLDIRAGGSPAEVRYDVTARTTGEAEEAIRVGGTFAREDGASRVTVARLDGVAAGHRLDLRRPLAVTLAGDGMVVDEFDLAVGGGTITGAGRTGPAGTEGRLVLSRLPLTLARVLWPDLTVAGTLDGTASVRSDGGDLAGRATLNLGSVRAAEMSQAPPLEASGSVTLGGGLAAAEVRIPRLGGSPLAFDASVPVRVDARTLAVEVSPQAPLSGRLTWSGSVARLWELLPLPEQRLTGEARVDLALAGTVAAPELAGEAGLANGRYEHFLTETVIDRLTLQVRSGGGGTVLLTLRGNDGGDGTIAGDGRAALAKGMAPLADMVVTFTKATLVRRDDVTATVSGTITFRQDEAGAALTGALASDRMEIRLIDRLPPSVVVLDVTEINLPPGQAPTRAPPPAAASAGPAVALDIAVTLPRRVFVRGRGLESEWQGHLRVSGSSADPRLVGTVEARSGTFDFAGKRFTLERGEIGFTGGASVNPTLNVEARRTTPEISAVIRVIGTALEPEIELTSTPALPESEILSRVLFDKSVAKLGPVEAAQLAMALDTLSSGESMSEDALSYVRNLLGLDVLTVEPGQEEGEGPAVGVGRYVADGVYVGARQGADQDSTAGTVEIEVLPGLAIESELSDGSEGATGALGLRWKWDY